MTFILYIVFHIAWSHHSSLDSELCIRTACQGYVLIKHAPQGCDILLMKLVDRLPRNTPFSLPLRDRDRIRQTYGHLGEVRDGQVVAAPEDRHSNLVLER